ncbi:MAG: flavodoxin domain-containing protein [Erysipelotrichaceae bacterium]
MFIPLSFYDEHYHTSVNAYLLKTEYFDILFDAGSFYTSNLFIQRLKKVTSLIRIKYILLHHVEGCHIGGLFELVKTQIDLKIIVNEKSYQYLCEMGYQDFSYIIVAHKDTLNINDYQITFINTPDLIWPNTMMSYVYPLKILFCSDVFGSRMNATDLENLSQLQKKGYFVSMKYYLDDFFICRKIALKNMLDHIQSFDIDILAPSHGAMIKDEKQDVLDLYHHFVEEEIMEDLIVVVYASLSGYTTNIALCIYEYLREYGLNVVIYNAIEEDGLMKVDIKKAKAVLFGSPTLYEGALTCIYQAMLPLNEKRYGKKLVSAFGSYGWNEKAVLQILNHAKVQHMCVMDDGFKVCFKLQDEDKVMLYEYLDQFIVNYLNYKYEQEIEEIPVIH